MPMQLSLEVADYITIDLLVQDFGVQTLETLSNVVEFRGRLLPLPVLNLLIHSTTNGIGPWLFSALRRRYRGFADARLHRHSNRNRHARLPAV